MQLSELEKMFHSLSTISTLQNCQRNKKELTHFNRQLFKQTYVLFILFFLTAERERCKHTLKLCSTILSKYNYLLYFKWAAGKSLHSHYLQIRFLIAILHIGSFRIHLGWKVFTPLQ